MAAVEGMLDRALTDAGAGALGNVTVSFSTIAHTQTHFTQNNPPPGAFILSTVWRIISVLICSTFGLLLFGGTGAHLGGATLWRGAARVLAGGWLAMGASYGIGRAFGAIFGAPLPAA